MSLKSRFFQPFFVVLQLICFQAPVNYFHRKKKARSNFLSHHSGRIKKCFSAFKTFTEVTAQKMKFSIKETADLVTFTEEILNGKLPFLCSVSSSKDPTIRRLLSLLMLLYFLYSLVIFTEDEKILNGELLFFCAVGGFFRSKLWIQFSLPLIPS